VGRMMLRCQKADIRDGSEQHLAADTAVCCSIHTEISASVAWRRDFEARENFLGQTKQSPAPVKMSQKEDVEAPRSRAERRRSIREATRLFSRLGIGCTRRPPKLSEAERIAALRRAEVALVADDNPLAISGRSALELALDACKFDFPRVLTSLLECDWNVLSKSFWGDDEINGDVFLQTAVRSGAINCVSLLISLGVNVNHSGYSLLHRAAEKYHVAMLAEILPHYVRDGAVDIPTQQPVDAEESACTRGVTPLMVACAYACFVNAKLLLQAGASRYVKDENKYSALHHCILGRSIACLQLILGDASKLHYAPEQLNEVDARGGTALHMAIICGSVEQCKLLLAAGADPLALLCGNLTCVDVARSQWPDRLELAALFHPEEHVPLVPLCCALCQKSCIKLSPCSTCHGVRYCSKACQRAHWRNHKPVCAPLPARMQTTMVPLSPTLHKS
jgi:ankyrin repeat protein